VKIFSTSAFKENFYIFGKWFDFKGLTSQVRPGIKIAPLIIKD
jgi:hypothetical protein